MSWSDDAFPHIPRTRDGSPNWAVDTDPVGPVTPELALVDPGLASGGGDDNEVTMSSMQFGDGTTFGAAEPVQGPPESQPAVPLQPIQPLTPPPPLAEPAAVPAPPAPAPVAAAEVSPPAPVEPAAAVPVSDMRDVPLGTLVFRAGLLPEERLEEALQEGMKTGKRLGEILLERGWVSEVDLGRLLAGQKGLPFVELDPATIDPTAPPLLHPEKARLHGALPIGFQGGIPVVAVADPSNDLVVENVRRALACEPALVVAGRDALHRAINLVYGAEAPVAEPVVAEPVAVAPVAVAPAVEPQPAPVVEPVVLEPIAPVAPVAPELTVPVVPPVAVEPVVTELTVPVVPPVAVEPVVTEPEPVQTGDGLWLGQPEPAQQTEPVPQPVAPVQPVAEVAAPEPVAVQPEPAPVVPAAPEPVVEPEPVAAPAPEPEPVATWAVVIRLTNGEQVELGSFAGEAAAIEQARGVIAQASSQDTWPFVGGRFIRPDAIVSVDLHELEVSRWLGSSTRAAALSPEHQQPHA